MGRYIQQTDLYVEFGKLTVREWAQHDKKGRSDDVDAIIDGAIAEAEGMLDDGLRGLRYSLPLTSVSASIKRLLRGWAIRTIYFSRGTLDKGTAQMSNKMTKRAEESDGILLKIQTGELSLDAGLNFPESTRVPTIANDCVDEHREGIVPFFPPHKGLFG